MKDTVCYVSGLCWVQSIVLLTQDLGYGTVRKRYRGVANRSSHLSTDSASPTTGQVCFGLFVTLFCLSSY